MRVRVSVRVRVRVGVRVNMPVRVHAKDVKHVPPPCDTRTFAQGFGGSLENLQGPMYKVLEPL